MHRASWAGGCDSEANLFSAAAGGDGKHDAGRIVRYPYASREDDPVVPISWAGSDVDAGGGPVRVLQGNPRHHGTAVGLPTIRHGAPFSGRAHTALPVGPQSVPLGLAGLQRVESSLGEWIAPPHSPNALQATADQPVLANRRIRVPRASGIETASPFRPILVGLPTLNQAQDPCFRAHTLRSPRARSTTIGDAPIVLL